MFEQIRDSMRVAVLWSLVRKHYIIANRLKFAVDIRCRQKVDVYELAILVYSFLFVNEIEMERLKKNLLQV